jgi:hypothetical protein
MIKQHSFKKYKYLIIICALSLITLITLLMYLEERNNYATEKERLEDVNMQVYDLLVESHLIGLSFFVGTQPDNSKEWDEQVNRKGLNSFYQNLDNGISNINQSRIEVVPDKILVQLKSLQEKIKPTLDSIQSEIKLDEIANEEIIDLSRSIYSCELLGYNSSWKQIETKLECLNKHKE